jgi:hypothetical protein
MGLFRALLRCPQRQDIKPRRSQEGIPDRMGRSARMSRDAVRRSDYAADGQVLRTLPHAGCFVAAGLPSATGFSDPSRVLELTHVRIVLKRRRVWRHTEYLRDDPTTDTCTAATRLAIRSPCRRGRAASPDWGDRAQRAVARIGPGSRNRDSSRTVAATCRCEPVRSRAAAARKSRSEAEQRHV